VNRRQLITSFAASAILPRWALANNDSHNPFYPPVLAGKKLQFPIDHGAHWLYRTEWWYLTAWLDSADGPMGLQLTFFRTRTRHNPDNPSRFAPKQIMFGHAAIASPKQPRLLHHELAARVMPDMMADTDTALKMRDQPGFWSLIRESNDQYEAVVNADQFSYAITLKPNGSPVLQGDQGFSRKGKLAHQASYYYSRPQCDVSGELRIGQQPAQAITGTGWLDHEWSSQLLDPTATGWDWVGLNLSNGDALMAFRIRDRTGRALFAHARWIRNGVAVAAEQPIWRVERVWQSPRTGARYPVEMSIQIGAVNVALAPLLDDQEIDASRSTQTVYWEGAVRAIDSSTGKPIGRGYLELTGYLNKIRL
jgi:predicted secreted hydrolase